VDKLDAVDCALRFLGGAVCRADEKVGGALQSTPRVVPATRERNASATERRRVAIASVICWSGLFMIRE